MNRKDGEETKRDLQKTEGQLHRKGMLKQRGERQTWSQSDKQRERDRERETERERERKKRERDRETERRGE